MKNKDLSQIIGGVVAVVVGVLIAVFGENAFQTYLAVLAIVTGSVLVVFAFYILATKKLFPLGPLASGGALIAIGSGALAGKIDLTIVIAIAVFAMFGVGAALIAFGIFAIAKSKKVPFGVAFIIIGAGLIALAACYLAFEDFRKVFWIIAGILIAVGGALEIVLALTDKKN